MQSGSHMNYTEENLYSKITKKHLAIYEENIILIKKYFCERILQNRTNKRIENIVLADFGTADGVNVMSTFRNLIGVAKNHLENVEILVVFEDQPANNHKVLMHNVQDFIENENNIHCLISGTSMYKKCLPSGFVDFGISVLAVQWLSRSMCISNGALISDATTEEFEQIKRQSLDDLYQFLSNRLLELKQGGFFFFACIARDKPDKPNYTDCSALLTQSLKDIQKQGLISNEEFKNIQLNDFPRNEDEFHEIFEKLRKNGFNFTVKHFKVTHQQIIPFQTDEKQRGIHKKEEIMEYMKIIFYNTILQGLSCMRSPDEKKCICDQYFLSLKNNMTEDFCEVSFHLADFFMFKD